MERIIQNDRTYGYYQYSSEKEFENMIVEKACHIFGDQSIYIDIKKKEEVLKDLLIKAEENFTR